MINLRYRNLYKRRLLGYQIHLVTMGSKTIKIDEENYKWLLKIASDIQKKLGKRVSFDEALTEIKNRVNEKK